MVINPSGFKHPVDSHYCVDDHTEKQYVHRWILHWLENVFADSWGLHLEYFSCAWFKAVGCFYIETALGSGLPWILGWAYWITLLPSIKYSPYGHPKRINPIHNKGVHQNRCFTFCFFSDMGLLFHRTVHLTWIFFLWILLDDVPLGPWRAPYCWPSQWCCCWFSFWLCAVDCSDADLKLRIVGDRSDG